MSSEQDLIAIANELDAVNAAARQAYLARDIVAYQEFFTDDLRYVQADGKTIGRTQLMRDVGKQLAQFKSVNSERTQESISTNSNGTVTEIINQDATYSALLYLGVVSIPRLNFFTGDRKEEEVPTVGGSRLLGSLRPLRSSVANHS